MNEVSNNKRIAKNTAYMYLRMMLLLAITLYTSRVIVDELGFADYGIYNLVAGVIVLFSFLSGTLNNASQRYMSMAIGRGDENFIQKVFSTSLLTHLLMVVLIGILTETVGLLFFDKLNIPLERMGVAMDVFHIAVLTTLLSIVRTPYYAAIISYERMSFFAWSSVVEAILKLLIVWVLSSVSADKLITYSWLLFGVGLLMQLWYMYYCQKHFKTLRNKLIYDKALLRDMLSFSGWNLFGGIADIGYKYGTGFILNAFFGVTLNATMGLVNQIRTNVYSFTSNLQVAANPQIVKSYTTGEQQAFDKLVCRISKFSYFLMFMVILPILLNLSFLLNLWLVDLPPYCVMFAALSLVFCLIDCLHGTQWVAMQACGKLRNYQIVISIILLLNLPVTYVCYCMGAMPYALLVAQIIISAVTLIVRLLFTCKYTHFPMREYLIKVVWPIVVVTLVSIPIPIWVAYLSNGWTRLILSSLVSLIVVGAVIVTLGLDRSERQFVLGSLSKFYRK